MRHRTLTDKSLQRFAFAAALPSARSLHPGGSHSGATCAGPGDDALGRSEETLDGVSREQLRPQLERNDWQNPDGL